MAQATPPARDNRFLLALLGFALVVRLVFLWQAAETPLFAAPGVDEAWHNRWANELLDYHWHYDGVYFRAPLYPYFLAGLYAVSERSIAFARTVQMLISTLSVGLLYLLARRLVPRGVARAAAIAMALYGTLIWYEQALLIPVLIIGLNLLLLYLLFRYKAEGSLRLLALAGLAGGLSLIARPNLMVFLAAAVIWLLWRGHGVRSLRRRLRHAALFASVAVLPVVPVALHNYHASGEFIPIASQGGINLYLGNNPAADGLTMQMPELSLDESISWSEFVPVTDSIARKEAGRALSPGEISSFWTGKFVDYATAHPLEFAIRLLKKTYYFFAGVENSDNFDLYFYRRLNPVYAAMVWRFGLQFPLGLVAPLAILGAVWLWPRRREFDLLYLFVLTYAPTVIGVLVTARHRLPVVPILIIFAAWGAFELWRRLRLGPMRARLASGGAALALGVFLNLQLFGVGFENPAQSHLNLALAYGKLGDTEAQQRQLDSALAIDSTSVEVLNQLATTYLQRGDLYMAGKYLERAVALAPGNLELKINRGQVFEQQGRYDEAAATYLDAFLQSKRTLPEPYFCMGRMCASRGLYDSALTFYNAALGLDPEYVEALNNIGSVYLSLGRPDTARFFWERAYRIKPDYQTAGVNLVRGWLEAGMPDSARADLEAGKAPWKGSADWYYYSAQTAAQAGDSSRARRDVGLALEIAPEHSAALGLARRLGVR
jgi:tetratricopeptide (TPR) repeat protein